MTDRYSDIPILDLVQGEANRHRIQISKTIHYFCFVTNIDTNTARNLILKKNEYDYDLILISYTFK